ncbi:19090_t:CDS:2, partial [Gigaspora rosea]
NNRGSEEGKHLRYIFESATAIFDPPWLWESNGSLEKKKEKQKDAWGQAARLGMLHDVIEE